VPLIKDEPDFGSEACETTLKDGSDELNIEVEETEIKVEEFNIKIEESIFIKEENPEAITVPPIESEPEVSVWGFCVRWQQFVFP
jgi:hypothetical protein